MTIFPLVVGLSSCATIIHVVNKTAKCNSGSQNSACGVATSIITTTTTAPTLPQVANNFGASAAQWNSDHTADPRAPGNYWPKLGDGRDTYSNLSYSSSGVVIGFTYALYPALPLQLAESLAISLLPSGSTQIQVLPSSSCLEIIYSSLPGLKPIASFLLGPSDMVKSIIFSVDTTSGVDKCTQ